MIDSRTENPAQRAAWAGIGVLLLSAGIGGTFLYGWVIAAVFLIAVMLPDFAFATLSKIRDGLARRRARKGTGPLDGAARSSVPRRINLYNAIHNWRLPAAVIVDGGIVWALGWPGGRETAFAGCAWLLHIAIDKAIAYQPPETAPANEAAP